MSNALLSLLVTRATSPLTKVYTAGHNLVKSRRAFLKLCPSSEATPSFTCMREPMTENNGRIPRRKSLTSLDVDRRAGVSRTAISYVLNEDGVRSTHVSEETRVKVLQAVKELGYSTHSSARALRKGQSDEICIIADLPLTIHRTELFVSVQQHAFLHGYAPVVYFSYGFSDEQLHSHLLKIFARRPIGIFATASSMTTQHIALAKRMGVDNIVLYSVEPLDYARTILLPTRQLGCLAAQHLLERGHRHLGLVRPADPLHDYGVQQRLEGMRATLAGMPGVRLDILPLQFDRVPAHSLLAT